MRPILLLALAACANAASTPPDVGPAVDRIPVVIETDGGPVRFEAEIADTDALRQKGLMFRTSMEDGHGMIFLFPEERQQSFWMKNTLIPLDMIFIRADRTILGIVESAEPETTSPRFVPGESQFVLEVNGGLAKKRGLKAGQMVKFYAPIPAR